MTPPATRTVAAPPPSGPRLGAPAGPRLGGGSPQASAPAPRPLPTPVPAVAPGQLVHPQGPGVPLGLPQAPKPTTPLPAPVSASPRPDTAKLWWSDLLPATSTTVAAWLLAAVPVGAVVAVGAVGWVQMAHPRWTLLALGMAAVTVVLVPILLVANDHSALRRMGWERQPRALSILLGSVGYLVARQWALRRQGAKVLPLTLGLAIGAVAALGLGAWAAFTWQDQLASWVTALSGALG